jgi:hypothetical protein
MDFERRHDRVLPRPLFLRRMARWSLVAGIVLAGSLALGVFGYHFIEGLPWIDALLNASMILGGMGPVDPLRSTGGKLFASFFALYSGLAIISIAGLLLAPLVHRLLHKFHLEAQAGGADSKKGKRGKTSF